jgi:uncharacterized membrane protein YhaH (DUF805 family)
MPPTRSPQDSLATPGATSMKKSWFAGRINRLTYLSGLLLIPIGGFLIGVVLSVPIFFIEGGLASSATPSATTPLVIVIACIFAILVAPFSISLGMRRLHDIGLSGWYLLVQAVLLASSLIIRFVGISPLLSALLYLLALVFSLVMLLKSGNVGSNVYGSPQGVGVWRGIWSRGLTK